MVFAMSEFLLILVLQNKTDTIIIDMANIALNLIKSLLLVVFFFNVMEKFEHYIGSFIDGKLGLRCSTFGY